MPGDERWLIRPKADIREVYNAAGRLTLWEEFAGDVLGVLFPSREKMGSERENMVASLVQLLIDIRQRPGKRSNIADDIRNRMKNWVSEDT